MTHWIDHPIETEEADRLERAQFASLIATALLEENEQRASVIGLTGSWGSGKSSVANFAVQRVRAFNSDIKVVEFEPWMVSTSEALAHEFFKEIGKAILPKDDSRESKEQRAKFYKYTALTLDALSLTSEASNSLGVPFAGLVAKGLKGSKKAIDLAVKGLEAQAQQPSLAEARKSLSKSLSEMESPVVVKIDDIDRLNSAEVRTVFQLIKACADFPNVRYLLLYDRDQVNFALKGSVDNPEAFLEKIVNQVFDLPEATKKQRTALLDEALSELGLHIDLPKIDRERLGILFDRVLLPGLTSIRQIKRFVNTVRALLPGVIADGFKNIDPADFLALEFIRQYAPGLYLVIRDESAPNAGGRVERMMHHKEWPERMKKLRLNAISKLPDSIQSLAKIAVESLYQINTSEASAHSSRRFNTDYWRSVYLGFSEARATVRESEWMEFIDLLKSSDTTESWLEAWSNRPLRDRWVTAICRRASEIPLDFRPKLMSALCKWGDRQQYEQSDWFMEENRDWESSVRYCCVSILESTSGRGKRIKDFQLTITESDAIVSPSMIVGLEVTSQKKGGWGSWAEDADLSTIVEQLEKRLTKSIESGDFWSYPDPVSALSAWGYLAPQKYEEWRKTLCADTARLAKHLNVYMGLQISDRDLENWQVETDYLKAIETIDLELLSENGKKARQHILDSAVRINHRQRRGMDDVADEMLESVHNENSPIAEDVQELVEEIELD